MKTLNPETALLLVIDIQGRLMPAICNGPDVIDNAARLIRGARLLGIPVCFTEQVPGSLGATVAELGPAPGEARVEKSHFDALRSGRLAPLLPAGCEIVIIGCEAHVCVLQTALGLLAAGYRVFLVTDAIGSRQEANRIAAITRITGHGAEPVSTEMVLFEWLGSAGHPRFRDILKLVK